MENLQENLQALKTNALGGSANLMAAVTDSYVQIITDIVAENERLKTEIISLKLPQKTTKSVVVTKNKKKR